MVKLLHAADLHLDSAFSALPPEKAAQRRAEQRLVLERLTALSEGCAAVLLAGDLFDSARVYRDTLEALRAALAACRCPVFIAPGNHDALLPGSPYLENGWPENVHIFRTACRSSTSMARASCARRCPPCWTASASPTPRA